MLERRRCRQLNRLDRVAPVALGVPVLEHPRRRPPVRLRVLHDQTYLAHLCTRARLSASANSAGASGLVIMKSDGRGRRVISSRVAPHVHVPGHVWSRAGEIFFIGSAPNDPLHLFRIRPDGSQLRDLTPAQRQVESFSLSPDGRRIAFAGRVRGAGLEIFVMNADGRAVLRLTTNRQHDLEPSWSPTGGRLAFTSERDGNSEIYVMDADGTGQRNITKNRAHDSRPAWRPSAERA